MRYQEAYELIDAGVITGGVELPVSHNLMEIYFDQAVNDIAMRAVRKKDYQTFSSSGKEYVFTKSNYSGQIYKVEFDQADVPFVDESAIISNVDDDDVSKIGYYIKTDVSTGSITGITSASPTVITSSSHGLDTGDFVIFSEIKGHYTTATKISHLNSKRLSITKVDDNSYSVAVNSSSGTTAYSSGGFWQEDTQKLYLTKNPDSGNTLKVYYYAKPEPKTSVASRVDLPEQLIPAAIHNTLGHFLNLGGNLQVGSGHMGLAKKLEQDYIETSRAKEPMPHIIPNPMQVFVTTRNGSIENTTGADD
jgi:hypothetical protein|tara:strand:+ start:225 stop:1142 length:918 start_codon:yes stop_codon:yes gene_type:complete